MNANQPILQSYLKLLQITLLTLVLMYFGKGLLIPLSFSLLLALILYPVCNWLEKHKLNRIIAITISITIVIIFFAAIMWLLLWQVTYLKNDLPVLVQKIKDALQQLQQWFYKNIGIIGLDTIWIENSVQNSGGGFSSLIRSLFKSVSSIFFSLFIIPVFTTLFLYHREQFVRFLQSLTPKKYHVHLRTILHETSYTYYKYIVGLIKVYLVVGTLNSIGLLLLGVDHAILFGMLTAFMTMIPYVGIIISSMLPITVAWVSTNSLFYPLGVIAIFAFVQYLENSVIFPKIVGQQLNVSSWAILVALIAGGIVWGVSGMVLFMPFVAILKIISGYIEEWKPLNILLSR